VKAILHAAEAEGPAAAVSYAIAIFGGVRMAELGRLKWAAITEDHIEIGRDIAKKHSRRLIPICPTLRAWINTYRGDVTDEDFIVPANWTDVSKAVRRRAGWAVSARILDERVAAKKMPELKKATRGEWPPNAPRHTCASVQVAIGASLEDLTFKFGHAGGHEVLRAHYVSRLTKKDALEILSTGPKGSKISNLSAA
jgi:integrase